MKYIIATLFTIITYGANAQSLSYFEGMVDYKGESIKTIDVILNPKVNTIKDKFEDWMDDNYDVDLDGKKLLFFNKEYLEANGVVISEVSDRKIDLKVKVDETTKGLTKLNVFASFGYNNWITEERNPSEFEALRGIVYDFVSEYLPEYYLEKVEESNEKLDDLSESRSNLKDEVKENQEDISKLEKENEELMAKLKANQEKIDKWNAKKNKRTKEYKSVRKKVSKIK